VQICPADRDRSVLDEVLFNESQPIRIGDIIANWPESDHRENVNGTPSRANGAPSEFAAPEVLSSRT
jgi:hypothetical protein